MSEIQFLMNIHIATSKICVGKMLLLTASKNKSQQRDGRSKRGWMMSTRVGAINNACACRVWPLASLHLKENMVSRPN